MSGRGSSRDLLLAVLVVGAVILAAHAAGIVLCPFRRFVGLPCPGCGSTRAVLALLQGDVAAALALNPLAVFLVFVGPLAWYFGRHRTWSRRMVVLVSILALLAVASNWAYLLLSC